MRSLPLLVLISASRAGTAAGRERRLAIINETLKSHATVGISSSMS